MFMEDYNVINLFETCWFEHQIFKRPNTSAFSSFGSNPDHETREKFGEQPKTCRFGCFSPYWRRLTVISSGEDSVVPEKVEPAESPSELEELKGFMDLGFVFSEEDKDSRLASVIPGLQRLGKRKEQGPLLMNWRVPNLKDETDVKNSLKCWAREVAFTVTGQ